MRRRSQLCRPQPAGLRLKLLPCTRLEGSRRTWETHQAIVATLSTHVLGIFSSLRSWLLIKKHGPCLWVAPVLCDFGHCHFAKEHRSSAFELQPGRLAWLGGPWRVGSMNRAFQSLSQSVQVVVWSSLGIIGVGLFLSHCGAFLD